MIRLSIIIPFYNVGQYIAECLDSVYNQDIPEEEYEVICVNDASPDNSRDIVVEYQKKHSNLILVEHEVNKKLGAARNTGRKIARGKYIWNVDSDDMIVTNCLKSILTKCEQNDLEVLVFGKLYYDGTFMGYDDIEWNEMNTTLSGVGFWKNSYINRIFPVWNKVFKTSYLNEHGIYSPEINMGEDVPFSIESVLLSKRILSTNSKYYIRRENPDSMTRKMYKKPSPKVVYENSFVCGRKIHDVLRKVKLKDKSVIESIKNIEKYILLKSSFYIDDMTPAEIVEFRKLCKKYFYSNLFVLNVLRYKKALKYLLFVVGYNR